MPKLIDYPRASFARTLELAKAVDYLGGSCTPESAADKMKKKISGAFRALIGATVKHKLITSQKNQLSVTELFKTIKHAYSDVEKKEKFTEAFLYPTLYKKIYEKYKDRELPVSMLERLLIREYEVDEQVASRVANYFIEGAKFCGILNNNFLSIVKIHKESNLNTEEDIEEDEGDEGEEELKASPETEKNVSSEYATLKESTFSVHFKGPGMNHLINLSDEYDFIILEAIINKVRKKIAE